MPHGAHAAGSIVVAAFLFLFLSGSLSGSGGNIRTSESHSSPARMETQSSGKLEFSATAGNSSMVKLSTNVVQAFSEWKYEDWLGYALSVAQSEGRRATFLQVGANDGIKNDLLFPVLKKNFSAWLGFMVEPADSNFKRLKDLHGGRKEWTLLKGVVMPKCPASGTVSFWEYRGDLNDSSIPLFFRNGQSNSLDFSKKPENKRFMTEVKQPCVDHLDAVLRERASAAWLKESMANPFCQSWGCNCQGLSDLTGLAHGYYKSIQNASECQFRWWLKNGCTTKPKKGGHPTSAQLSPNATRHWIDVFQVDVEGFDFEVIKSLDVHQFRPKIIMYESKMLDGKSQGEARLHLEQAGYWVKTHREDTLCVDYAWLQSDMLKAELPACSIF